MRGGGKRRETLWIGSAAVQQALATAAPFQILNFNAAALALRPFTIVRTRGVIVLRSDQVAATEDYGAAVGFSVVSDQAVAIGVTAVPTPNTDVSSDLWFVYETIFGRFLFASAVGQNDGQVVQRQFDSKAMRKVEDGQDLSVTVEAAPFQGSSITVQNRMLVKLH